MRTSRFVQDALWLCAAAAMLADCGGHVGDGVTPTSAAPNSLPNRKSFDYTGGPQYFTVPAGVRQIKVIARGAKGAGSPVAYGGRVHAVIPVTPGEKLVVYVGGDASGPTGGFNGGANGGVKSSADGNGGGGASDVREGDLKLSDRVLVAGGGGGEGGRGDDGPPGQGGGGGGLRAGSGSGGSASNIIGGGGGGGTQNAGGAGGSGGDGATMGGKPGRHGSARRGGHGGASCQGSGYCGYNGGGGGGGGGYYGGGGGGAGGGTESNGGAGGGGGGGSSYAEPTATSVHFWQAWKATKNGLVVVSW